MWIAWGEAELCKDETGNSVFHPKVDPGFGNPIPPALDPQHLCFQDTQAGCKSPFDSGSGISPSFTVLFCSLAVALLATAGMFD
jgi:hypothetical protein